MKKSIVFIFFLSIITIALIVFGEQQFKNAGKAFTKNVAETTANASEKGKKEIKEEKKETPQVNPLAVFTFDDGADSDYEIVYPLLEAHQIKGTSYLVGNWVAAESFMTVDQIAEMHENGWEFQDHTIGHLSLNELSLEEAESQIVDNGAFLESLNLGNPEHLALPIVDITEEMRDMFASHRLTIRNSENDLSPVYNTWDEIALDNLQVINLSTHDLEQIIADIDEAIAENAIMIFSGHRIGDEEYRTPYATLEAVVQYISEKEIETATISDMYDQVVDYQGAND